VTSASKLLLYCVAERSPLETDTPGLDDKPVQRLDFQDIFILSSSFPIARTLSQDDALRFHAVLRSVFDHQAIIPFRFPTLMEGAELRSHLRENHAKYSADLARLRDFVQMELRLSGQSEESAAKSGKEYLEGRLQRSRRLREAAQAIREVTSDLVSECKEQATDQGLRLFALTRRKDISAFRERIHKTKLSEALTILVSGPWPATEFLHD
jgi:hypothetical protein